MNNQKITSKGYSNPDNKIWHGLKLHVRLRLARAVGELFETGSIRRSDLVRIGEISNPQASKDLREITDRIPKLMKYNLREKHYELEG
jgi:hypothetical protein